MGGKFAKAFFSTDNIFWTKYRVAYPLKVVVKEFSSWRKLGQEGAQMEESFCIATFSTDDYFFGQHVVYSLSLRS